MAAPAIISATSTGISAVIQIASSTNTSTTLPFQIHSPSLIVYLRDKLVRGPSAIAMAMEGRETPKAIPTTFNVVSSVNSTGIK